MRTAHFLLEAEPGELETAVDVEALLTDVALALTEDETGDAVAHATTSLGTVYRALAAEPCRIKVAPGREIAAIAQALGAGCSDRGLFAPPRLILVIRLDWRRLLAHELAHLVRHLLGGLGSEREAQSVEDAVG